MEIIEIEEVWEYVEKEHGPLSRREAMVTLTAVNFTVSRMAEEIKSFMIKKGYIPSNNE